MISVLLSGTVCVECASDGAAGGGGRGRQRTNVLQLLAEFDRTPLHPARRQTVLHRLLRTAVRQQVRGVQTGDRNRFQGWAISFAVVRGYTLQTVSGIFVMLIRPFASIFQV